MTDFKHHFSDFKHSISLMALTRNQFRFSVQDVLKDDENIQEKNTHLIHKSFSRDYSEDKNCVKVSVIV